jgi:hypothetical protein
VAELREQLGKSKEETSAIGSRYQKTGENRD